MLIRYNVILFLKAAFVANVIDRLTVESMGLHITGFNSMPESTRSFCISRNCKGIKIIGLLSQESPLDGINTQWNSEICP